MIALLDRATGLLSRLAAAIGALALIASLALVFYSVLLRYLFNRPQPWIDELAGYLLVATVMLAAAEALRRDEHIAVDLMTAKLGPAGRRRVALAGFAAMAVTAALILAGGWEMVAFSNMVGLISEGYLAVPKAWPESLVPIGAGLLLLAALVGFLNLLVGRAERPE